MTYHVRKYRESDRDAVRKICHLTATAPAYVKNPELVATLYADYYTEFEPDGIFYSCAGRRRRCGRIYPVKS